MNMVKFQLLSVPHHNKTCGLHVSVHFV